MRPLGATEAACRSTCGIVAATNRDLAGEVRDEPLPRGSLLPPARGGARAAAAARAPRGRARARQPLPASARRAARKVIGLEPEALERLIAHRWPGNVRELENTIEAAIALAQGPRVTRGGSAARAASTRRAPRCPSDIALSLEAFERACLDEALRRCQRRRAARREAARHRPQHVLPQAATALASARQTVARQVGGPAITITSASAGKRAASASAQRSKRFAHDSGRRASSRAQRRTPHRSDVPAK